MWPSRRRLLQIRMLSCVLSLLVGVGLAAMWIRSHRLTTQLVRSQYIEDERRNLLLHV